MAGKKENIKALFSNSRSRIIILFTVILLIITVVIGVMRFGASTGGSDADATLESGGGNIQGTPGSLNQTAQYAELQETQNIEQAKQASQTGGSAIPTIIRTHAFGEGVQIIGQKEGEGGVDFSALTYDNSDDAQKFAWKDMLNQSNCSKVSMNKVIAQGGAVSDLKTSCSCEQLKNAGFKVGELEPVCTCAELKTAGFDIVQMKEAGFTAGRLRLCGYVACDAKGVGFSAQEMKDAGFSDGELKGAGFSEQDIARAGGLPDGMTSADVQKAGCDPTALAKLRAAGVTAAAIRRINGCSADKLKAAGFTAGDLKKAGYSAADMKEAGFSAAELRAAGMSARDLLNAGFTGDDLANAGFTTAEIKAAEAVLPLGLTPADIKKAGCSVEAIKRQRLAGVSASAIHQHAGCSAESLSQAGFRKNDLLNAGFKPADIQRLNFLAGQSISDGAIQAAGCDPDKLKGLLAQGVSADRVHKLNGCSADILKKAGYDAKSLLEAGFTPAELLSAGFSPNDIQQAMAALGGKFVSDGAIQSAGCDPDKLKGLLAQGVSADRIHKLNGCSADILKKAGYDAKSLLEAGFTPAELLGAGFTPNDIQQAMVALGGKFVSDGAIKAAGCDPDKLKGLLTQGVTADRIHKLNGCSVDILKKAGFDAKSLVEAGFTPAELLSAGFTPDEIKQAMAAAAMAGKSISDDAIQAAGCDPDQLKGLMTQGVTADRIHKLNGCSIDLLKQAGFDAKSLADAGFTPEDLLAAGFTPEQLIQAGLSPTAVVAAGRTADCSVKSLKAARQLGVSAAVIKQTLGCSANALNAAGFSAVDLKNAGFTAAELKNAGFSLADLKDAGFSAKELAAAGFTAKQMADAGFTALQLKNAGFTAQQLKDAGITAQQLKDAGFSASDLKKAGFSALDLKKAGFAASDLKKAGFNASDLKNAGFTANDLKNAGFNSDQMKLAGYTDQEMREAGFSVLAGLDAVPQDSSELSTVLDSPEFGSSTTSPAAIAAANAKRIEEMRSQQEKQLAAQRYQQKIQEQGSAMMAAANQAIQEWRVSPQQIYTAGTEKEDKSKNVSHQAGSEMAELDNKDTIESSHSNGSIVIRTGDILFAVIDTSVNTDEPGPILATIVSGKLKGSKLIGSFNLPGQADKMVVTFNTLSVLGGNETVSINAFAIDPNTARTALSSQTDHHYLARYGALFASTFLQGFGNAFQSANTTITIGGTGGTTDTTVESGIGRSTLDNAVIGLATLGKAWGQVAAQNMNRPTTVQLYAGTGVGILFTQNVKIT